MPTPFQAAKMLARKYTHMRGAVLKTMHVEATQIEAYLEKHIPGWHRWLLKQFPWSNRLLRYSMVLPTATNTVITLIRHGRIIAQTDLKNTIIHSD